MSWTSADLIAIEAAIRTAITEGVASVSIGGETVQTYSLKELRELRAEIKSEVAIANPLSRVMYMRKTIPPAAG